MKTNATPLEVANKNHRLFQPGFTEWLSTASGDVIYRRFEEEALAMAGKRDHWSARTIIEYIRHETALRDAGPWKINNNTAPDCARLFALRYPAHKNLFAFREQDRRKARMQKIGTRIGVEVPA